MTLRRTSHHSGGLRFPARIPPLSIMLREKVMLPCPQSCPASPRAILQAAPRWGLSGHIYCPLFEGFSSGSWALVLKHSDKMKKSELGKDL